MVWCALLLTLLYSRIPVAFLQASLRDLELLECRFQVDAGRESGGRHETWTDAAGKDTDAGRDNSVSEREGAAGKDVDAGGDDSVSEGGDKTSSYVFTESV
jgi:hypothetical protein